MNTRCANEGSEGSEGSEGCEDSEGFGGYATTHSLSGIAVYAAENRVVAGVRYPEDNDKGGALGVALGGYYVHTAAIDPTAAPKAAVQWLWQCARAVALSDAAPLHSRQSVPATSTRPLPMT